jgi:hypothetical protein
MIEPSLAVITLGQSSCALPMEANKEVNIISEKRKGSAFIIKMYLISCQLIDYYS